MNTSALRTQPPTLPTEQEAQIARQSSRLIPACIGRGATARLRVIDGQQEVEVREQLDTFLSLGRTSTVSGLGSMQELL